MRRRRAARVRPATARHRYAPRNRRDCAAMAAARGTTTRRSPRRPPLPRAAGRRGVWRSQVCASCWRIGARAGRGGGASGPCRRGFANRADYNGSMIAAARRSPHRSIACAACGCDVAPARGARVRAAGFTLIEIMVVIVILGILAALVVPSILSRTDDARVVAAKSDIAAILQALKLY